MFLFFPGDGPADYDAPQHVDPAVIADIANWMVPGRQRIARLLPSRKR
ncbi:hypothetical protein [Saccharopolyspora sp. 5N708]